LDLAAEAQGHRSIRPVGVTTASERGTRGSVPCEEKLAQRNAWVARGYRGFGTTGFCQQPESPVLFAAAGHANRIGARGCSWAGCGPPRMCGARSCAEAAARVTPAIPCPVATGPGSAHRSSRVERLELPGRTPWWAAPKPRGVVCRPLQAGRPWRLRDLGERNLTAAGQTHGRSRPTPPGLITAQHREAVADDEQPEIVDLVPACRQRPPLSSSRVRSTRYPRADERPAESRTRTVPRWSQTIPR
jgi:hypothetical protein